MTVALLTILVAAALSAREGLGVRPFPRTSAEPASTDARGRSATQATTLTITEQQAVARARDHLAQVMPAATAYHVTSVYRDRSLREVSDPDRTLRFSHDPALDAWVVWLQASAGRAGAGIALVVMDALTGEVIVAQSASR